MLMIDLNNLRECGEKNYNNNRKKKTKKNHKKRETT